MNFKLITIFGIAFIFIMTTLGSAVVFFFKNKLSDKINSVFLGFASGIMIAASVWSLLLPAIDGSTSYGKLSFMPAAIGFVLGGVFLILLDRLVPLIHPGKGGEEAGSPALKTHTKLFVAITVHNIPEGLAVGFAFGAAAALGTQAAYLSALGLAIGIGIQNFPEGAAVSLPMKSITGSRSKAFLYGAFSGAVEPVFAVLGFFLASSISMLQPWLLSFAAGAMIFVVAEDLIPESKLSQSPHLATWGVMLGFVLMMILDVALG